MKTLFADPKEIKSILNDVQKVAAILWQRGWSEKNAGNISVRLPQTIDIDNITHGNKAPLDVPLPALKNTCFYMTGTVKRMQDVADSAIDNGLFVQIDPSGTACHIIKISGNELNPTSELPSHLGIHHMIAERHTGETVVVHTHATEIIALTQYDKIKSTASLNRILWSMHPETMIFIPKGVGFVPYTLPGTKEIADATIEKFAAHDIVVWEKHGIFAIGRQIVDTFDSIDIVCKSAKIWFQCRSAGFEPEGLTERQLEELRGLVQKFQS